MPLLFLLGFINVFKFVSTRKFQLVIALKLALLTCTSYLKIVARWIDRTRDSLCWAGHVKSISKIYKGLGFSITRYGFIKVKRCQSLGIQCIHQCISVYCLCDVVWLVILPIPSICDQTYCLSRQYVISYSSEYMHALETTFIAARLTRA